MTTHPDQPHDEFVTTERALQELERRATDHQARLRTLRDQLHSSLDALTDIVQKAQAALEEYTALQEDVEVAACKLERLNY